METFLRKNGYTIYRCVECGLGRTDLRKNYGKFVTENYDKGYFTGDPARSAYVNYKEDKPYIVANMRQFLRRVKKYKPAGKLLDVGCALGFFVELALKHGYDAYGCDPSDYAVREAKRLVGSTRIKKGAVHDVEYGEKSFDVITLFDVFEHLGDPSSDIEKLSRFLKDDGIMVVATGNTDSLMAKIFKRRWTFYIPPQHLFFFNKKTFTVLFRKHGLTVREWFHIGKWLSLRYMLHLARTTGESKIAHRLYSLTKPIHRAPIFLPVGDNMVAVMRKLNYS